MHYWRLRVCVNGFEAGAYDVYYRDEIPRTDVAKQAVIDGYLCDAFYKHVVLTEEITAEAYYEKMWD
jgi:hypothetical protein